MSKHHYIPQFYLKGFTDPTCPAEQEPYIWLYEKGKKTSRKRAPKNVANKPYYYAAETDNGLISTPEVSLSKIESSAALILRKLADNHTSFTPEERLDFSIFIALMFLRVPRHRKNIEDSYLNLVQMITRMIVSKEEYFRNSVRRFEEKTGNRIDMPIGEFYNFVKDESRYELVISPNVSLRYLFKISVDLAPVLAKMNWLFLKAKGGRAYFLTSDCPVALSSPKAHPFYGTGFGTKSVEVTLPLSRDICLLATWQKMEGYQNVTDNIVEIANQRTIAFALKEVYSSEQSLKVQNLINKYSENPQLM